MAQPPSTSNTPTPQATAAAPPPAAPAAPAINKSHGRGGAGNINSKPSTALTSGDLTTPTLKSATYTTGRGGSGNMASNNPSNPNEARAAQDVDTPLHHAKEMSGTYHWGRGGEGNMTTIKSSNGNSRDTKAEKMDKLSGAGAKEVVKEKLNRGGSKERPGMGKERTFSSGSESAGGRRRSFNAALNRGKEMLGFNKKPATPVGGVSTNGEQHHKIPEETDEKRNGSNDESAIAD